MIKYRDSVHNERSFLSLTGFTPHEFVELLPFFVTAWADVMDQSTLTGYPRTGRTYASYQTSPLPTPEDKLFFILVYLKNNTTQEIHGRLFGMSQSNANKWIHAIHPALTGALALCDALPARTPDSWIEHPDTVPDVPDATPLFS